MIAQQEKANMKFLMQRTTPYTFLEVRRMARRLWTDPAMQRRWLRAWLTARRHGGLILEGSKPKWRA
jgi:hypothetical protein